MTEQRKHGPSPWRSAYEQLVATIDRSGRAPSFGITEERGPGGVVIPLFRGGVPVCDLFPDADLAFAALLDFHARFTERYPRTNGGTE